ncbi:MAG: hypothetical protein ACYC2O_11205 [Microthrixaceae bacterium]
MTATEPVSPADAPPAAPVTAAASAAPAAPAGSSATGTTGIRRRAHWALAGFAIGVFLARVVTTVLHLRGAGANGGLIIDGVHIHHAIFGLTILAVITTGWMLGHAVDTRSGARAPLVTAGFWGFAWALILDEFALLVHLKDVYWLPEGEESLYAMFIFGVVLVVAAFRAPR